MPLIKQDALAVSREEFTQIKLELDVPYKFHLLARDDQRILFLRTTHADPDPVSDLEACLERVPDASLRGVQHLVLVGANGNLHLPASVARPLLDRREALDRTAVAQLRAGLRPDYGVAVHRVAGDPASLLRIGVRIPRQRCLDLNEVDLRAMAQTVGPLVDDRSTQGAVVGYIVADEDHVRLQADELLADLAPRWEEEKKQRLAPRTLPAPAHTAPPAPEPAAPVRETPAPRRRPTRTIRVKPVVNLEFTLDAIPPEVDYDPTVLASATQQLDELLQSRGFDVLRNVAQGEQRFSLAAERNAGYPRRILVRTLGRFSRVEAHECLRMVRELDADLLIAINEQPDDEALRRTVATKVKVLTPREVSHLRL